MLSRTYFILAYYTVHFFVQNTNRFLQLLTHHPRIKLFEFGLSKMNFHWFHKFFFMYIPYYRHCRH